jgi:hypothetical protein
MNEDDEWFVAEHYRYSLPWFNDASAAINRSALRTDFNTSGLPELSR